MKTINLKNTYIIAEIGNNHNGSVSKAKKLIDIAKECGVNAVKFQSFTGKDIVASNVLAKEYPEWDDESLNIVSISRSNCLTTRQTSRNY